MLLTVIVLLDATMLWSACAGSKRKDEPVYFEEEGFLSESAFKG
jgi:hypothetical protein